VTAPEKLIIDTPEQIALEFPLASAGSRFLALAIDTAIELAGLFVLGAVAVVATILGTAFGRTVEVWGMAIVVFLGFVIYYGYFAIFEALWHGQTPGKRAVGIRVIAASGRPLSALDAVLRNLLRIVDQLPGIYAVGLVSVFFTERNQRLGDLAAGTVVVYERGVERPHVPTAGAATRHGAARLTSAEIALIETFLQRRDGLDPYLKLNTARQIVARLRHRLDIPADARLDEEKLLEELVAEYRAHPPRPGR
jgi:uncharacterized RDD family membrane protein YckC